MIYGSIRHDYNGRKIKRKKVRGEVYGKYAPTPFKPITTTATPSYSDIRMAEANRYKSNEDYSITGGTKTEPQKYTGDYVIGISTMHKSNMVPITSGQEAKDHANMRR